MKRHQLPHRKDVVRETSWRDRVNASLAELAEALSRALPWDEVASLALRHGTGLTGSRLGYLGRLDQENGLLVISRMTGGAREICQVTREEAEGGGPGGLWGRIYRSPEAVCLNDLAADPEVAGFLPGDPPIRRFLSAPALIGGAAVGWVVLANAPRAYGREDVWLIERLAGLYALALQRIWQEEELRAYRDRLGELVKRGTADLQRANEALREEARSRGDAEEALKKSEERFRTVADFTYDWEYWVGPNGDLLYVSPSCERITGYHPEEFRRDPTLIEKIVHPEDRSRFAAYGCSGAARAAGAAVATGVTGDPRETPHIADFRVITKWGEERWVGHVCRAVHGAEGERLGRRASNRDITDRVRAETALREQERAAWEQTRQQLAESRSLERVATTLLEQPNLEDVLAVVCDEARRLNGASGSAILLREEEDSLKVVRATGEPVPSTSRVSSRGTLVAQVLETGEPIVAGSPTPEALPGYSPGTVHSVAIAPLKTGVEIIGVLEVVNRLEGFGEGDLRILPLFAAQAAVAIEKARLNEQAERGAIIEERQRLARELHDSVTQTLYSVTLFADAARLALGDGDTAAVRDHLLEVRDMAREAMLDMRVLIFQLHPPALEEEGLTGAIQSRLAAVEVRAGLTTEFRVHGEGRIPGSVEQELFALAQEGLNNVVKHSHAQRVVVDLRFRDGGVCLEIRDDGAGFDPSGAERRGGVGLRGMEERMHKIGGTFQVESAPGRGATLRADVNIP